MCCRQGRGEKWRKSLREGGCVCVFGWKEERAQGQTVSQRLQETLYTYHLIIVSNTDSTISHLARTLKLQRLTCHVVKESHQLNEQVVDHMAARLQIPTQSQSRISHPVHCTGSGFARKQTRSKVKSAFNIGFCQQLQRLAMKPIVARIVSLHMLLDEAFGLFNQRRSSLSVHVGWHPWNSDTV